MKWYKLIIKGNNYYFIIQKLINSVNKWTDALLRGVLWTTHENWRFKELKLSVSTNRDIWRAQTVDFYIKNDVKMTKIVNFIFKNDVW